MPCFFLFRSSSPDVDGVRSIGIISQLESYKIPGRKTQMTVETPNTQGTDRLNGGYFHNVEFKLCYPLGKTVQKEEEEKNHLDGKI